MKEISTPLNKEKIKSLKANEFILFSGIIYTARDQAHKRIIDLLKQKRKIPFPLKNQVIYYSGPIFKAKKTKIGSCGPTTSIRMDSLSEPLLRAGILATIGKGRRSKQFKELLKKYGGIYLLAPSGCGALIAKKTVDKEVLAFKDLGPEAVYRLKVVRLPLIVGIDTKGQDIYDRLSFI